MEILSISQIIRRQTLTICLSISLSLITVLSFSQSLTDFSGKWILDNSKSSSVFAKTSSTINITQADNKINLEIAQSQKDAKPTIKSVKYLIGAGISGANPSTSNPNHRETTLTSKWGPNKQSFIIKQVTSVFVEKETPKESTNIKVYSLSDGGKIMTIKSDDTLPKGSVVPENERHTQMVFNKAK